MKARILQGDVFELLPTLPPRSVDCCVSSPPYWMLRSYLGCDCGHTRSRHNGGCADCSCKRYKDHPLKPLELGSEPTAAKYVANMVHVFGLVREALADHGTVWLNIGDTYAGVGKSGGGKRGQRWEAKGPTPEGPRGGRWFQPAAIAEGNLCLIPQRLAIALQDDGWCVRSVVVWHKPAPMPTTISGWLWARCRRKLRSQRIATHTADVKAGHRRESNISVNFKATWTDCPGCKKCKPKGGYVLRRGSWRPTASWEPVLMLAKAPGYFCDGVAVQQPAASATLSRNEYTRVLDDPDEQFAVKHNHESNLTTANPRDVWTIGAEPLREKHYAAFPTELVRRCLQAGTSAKGYCPACGLPWVRVVDVSYTNPGNRTTNGPKSLNGRHERPGFETRLEKDLQTLDWRPACGCPPAEPRPGLVLDPFAGSGRTLIAARDLGLDSVGIELNPEYAEMARGILRADAPLFATLNQE